MLMRCTLLFALVLLPLSASGESKKAQWLSEFGIGIESGASIREKATSLRFEPGFAIGPNLSLGIVRIGFHQVNLDLGYQYHVGDYTGGTTQLEVRTTYQRLVLAPGYFFRHKLIVAGVQLGAAMNVITTQMTYNELLIEYDSKNDEYEFHKIGEIDRQDATGVDFGFFAGVSVGLDFSGLILKTRGKSLLDLCLKGDYVRRGERDDFFAGISIVFWPTGLIR